MTRTRDINLADLRQDRRRDGPVDLDHVESMRLALRRGDTLPPVDVADLGDMIKLLDGYDRVRAHRLERRKTILANVIVEATP
ncbi:hypothetical protein ACQR1Y_11590 [Bradyrhizobium sp. HKCCYLRH3099]|uniref:hypothetical protein n=1 Tax=unclassified Bradyrhizobium TaxID=2631580 RepID=UPI003EBBEA7C